MSRRNLSRFYYARKSIIVHNTMEHNDDVAMDASSGTTNTTRATTSTAYHNNNYGTVLRTAFRRYDKQDSKPSGRKYTTRKDGQPNGIRVTTKGIQGDYNHYRTIALQSTPNRAVSLWTTTDVLPMLQSAGYATVQVGDLGENISLEGINYTYFQVGEQYRFVSSSSSSQQYLDKQEPSLDQEQDRDDDDNDSDDDGTDVILEITERVEPCANLCKLDDINDPKLQPKERIQRCQDFINLLNQDDGLRGWYAKVIQEGFIRPGDYVVKVDK